MASGSFFRRRQGWDMDDFGDQSTDPASGEKEVQRDAQRQADRKEPGFPARVFALFTQPRAAFGRPRGPAFWIPPLILFIVTIVASSVLLADLNNQMVVEFVEDSTFMSDADKERALESMEVEPSVGRSILNGLFGAGFSVLVSIFLLGALYYAGVNFGLGATAGYFDIVGVLSLSSVALALREWITLPIKLAQQTLQIYTGPAALFEPGSSIPFIIAGFFDVFDLFNLFLITVGLSVVAKIRWQRTVIIVGVFWILWCGMRLIAKLSPLGALTS